jgi:hypothetical protein
VWLLPNELWIAFTQTCFTIRAVWSLITSSTSNIHERIEGNV